VLEQLAEPLGGLHVGPAAGHVLDVLGVHEPELEVVLEQVLDRLPIAAGGLHRHVRYAEPLEPIAQRQQSGGIDRPPMDLRPRADDPISPDPPAEEAIET
jgi:hypothetical protein